MFWQITSSSDSKPSIVYGTIHLSTASCTIHWPRVEDYLNRYDHVFTESSLDREAALFVRPFMLLEEGLKVFDFITPEKWQKIRNIYIKYCGIDIDYLKMYRPIFIITQLQLSLMNAVDSPPIDQMIWDHAVQNECQLSGLESPHEQVEILKSLDIAGHYRFLVRMSKNISNTRKKLNDLIRAYGNEDIVRLYRLSKSTLGKDQSRLIAQRNELLARRIWDAHLRSPSFFSFGAGHLAGGHGVLRILKRLGATVTAIMN